MESTRRTFLMSTAATAVLAQPSPNDRIRLGLIGCGGRGRDLLKMVVSSGENAAITAVCDVWRVNREAMAREVEMAFGQAPFQTTRYQEILARKDVDAVLIATPDFTHPKILADAVQAGKDAYVEKPFATTFEEARMAYDAVKRTDRVVQVGTQRRSEAKFMAAAEAIRKGVIGKVTRVSMEYHFF
ncbi:MAG: Gfo/Idh/MocA family oxidoreductase, partial [Bryobacteraceae bacterium]